jgi:Phage integrase family
MGSDGSFAGCRHGVGFGILAPGVTPVKAAGEETTTITGVLQNTTKQGGVKGDSTKAKLLSMKAVSMWQSPVHFLDRQRRTGVNAEVLAQAVQEFKKLFDKTGIPNAHPHRFRDAFAVSLLERGVPIRAVSRALGQSSGGNKISESRNFCSAAESASAAPGEGVMTTCPWGTYAAGWGTSFSAPFVSGTAALMLGRQRELHKF